MHARCMLGLSGTPRHRAHVDPLTAEEAVCRCEMRRRAEGDGPVQGALPAVVVAAQAAGLPGFHVWCAPPQIVLINDKKASQHSVKCEPVSCCYSGGCLLSAQGYPPLVPAQIEIFRILRTIFWVCIQDNEEIAGSTGIHHPLPREVPSECEGATLQPVL